MKIEVQNLGDGQEFTTCLTRRKGIVLDNDSKGVGVRVAFEDGEHKNLHPEIVVEAAVGLARLR